jgi:hypothetical protein
MKNIPFNSRWATFAATVAGLLLFGSVHFRALAQPASENDRHSVRPEFYFIQGEVNVPQRYVYTNGLTLTAALKRAKGLTADALPTKISITRMGEKALVIDYKAIEQGKAKDMELRPGDKVFVARK